MSHLCNNRKSHLVDWQNQHFPKVGHDFAFTIPGHYTCKCTPKCKQMLARKEEKHHVSNQPSPKSLRFLAHMFSACPIPDDLRNRLICVVQTKTRSIIPCCKQPTFRKINYSSENSSIPRENVGVRDHFMCVYVSEDVYVSNHPKRLRRKSRNDC